jgi:hypothetical protein
LSVSGLLVSGDLIGGKNYFNEFARQFKDGLRDISSETVAGAIRCCGRILAM